jgi:cytochrome c-type biogenesis protein
MDWIGDLLAWLEPWLGQGLESLEGGSLLGVILALVAGIALGLSPATYPLVPVVVGYAGGGKNVTRRRAALLSLAFVAGITTVYVALGALWGSFGLLLLDLLSRSLWLWYGIGAAALLVMGLRLLGLFHFKVPLLAPPDPETGRRRGVLGAYLLGVPFGLAGCPSCAPILLAVLTAVAASGKPLMGALAMLALGLGQGSVLVAAGAYGGTLTHLNRFARHRLTIERLLGLLLLLAAAYFGWQALLGV